MRGLTGFNMVGVVKESEREEFFYYWDKMRNSPKCIYFQTEVKTWLTLDVVLNALKRRKKTQTANNIKLVRKFFREYKERENARFKEQRSS